MFQCLFLVQTTETQSFGISRNNGVWLASLLQLRICIHETHHTDAAMLEAVRIG
jgi:hypothetical protein